MNKLTSFQIKCREELIKKVKSLGINIPDFTVLTADKTDFAEEEVFMEAFVNDIRIWIYEDGAHIKGIGENVPFEDLDYNTEEDLIRAFCDKVVVLLQKE